MLERGRERRVGKRSGTLQVADVQQHERPARRGRDDRRRIRPAHDERQVRVGLKRPRDLGDRLVAPDDARLQRDAAQSDRRAGLEQPRARSEDERRQPVGELHRAVGERHGRIGHEQTDRADRHEPGIWGKACEHVVRLDAVAGQEARDQPRTGQSPRDVVLQVGVQPAVARVEFGRRADRQHRRVERVEPQPVDRRRQGGVRVLGPEVSGERQRLVVGDVQPAQRIVLVVVDGGDGPHRRLHPLVQELKPAARQLTQ